ncbi:hypothetical protein BLNAU_168 [Blattamonas nauphoetae]|uniref:Uncharacterized protein n=1 Tax=Blattamonas nauphoetae TaxID=2049346 RepID=A0ABQ9YM95_9EUKA|nr:hypothetical protein BLNAU_168 [Blattamonas nauphoetae]
MSCSHDIDSPLRETRRHMALMHEDLSDTDEEDQILLRSNKRDDYHRTTFKQKEEILNPESYDPTTDLEELLTTLNGENPQNVQELFTTLRKITYSQEAQVQLLQHNVIPMLTYYLTHSQDQSILFDIMWILLNIASLPSQNLTLLFDDDLLSSAIQLTQHNSISILENVWWFLSNISQPQNSVSTFAQTLINLGIFAAFQPSLSIVLSHAIPTLSSFRSTTTTFLDTNVIMYPSMKLEFPETPKVLSSLLNTLKNLIKAVPQQLPIEIFSHLFSSLMAGCREVESVLGILSTQYDQLRELSSPFYQTPIPLHFPPTIQTFPQLIVAVLSYATEGLSTGYQVWHLLSITRIQRRVCERRQFRTTEVQPIPIIPKEVKTSRHLLSELRGYFSIIERVSSFAGHIMNSSVPVIDYYLDSGLLTQLGKCLSTILQFKRHSTETDQTILAACQMTMRRGDLGEMWREVVELVVATDFSTLASREEICADFRYLGRIKEASETGEDVLLRDLVTRTSSSLSYCLSNIVGGPVEHVERVLSEVFPGSESADEFMNCLAELLDDPDQFKINPLFVLHGLVLTPKQEVFELVEESQAIDALFTFAWYHPHQPNTDTAVRTFYEILCAIVATTQNPSKILAFLESETVRAKMEEMQKGLSEPTKKRIMLFQQKHRKVLNSFLTSGEGLPTTSVLSAALDGDLDDPFSEEMSEEDVQLLDYYESLGNDFET